MSPIQSVALAIRLFVIWLTIYCARWAPYLYRHASDSDDIGAKLFVAAVTIAFVLFASFLWVFPRSVARTILPPGDAPTSSGSSPEIWFSVGCAILGLWVLTDAVPGLVQNLYIFVYAQRANLPIPESWASSTVYYIVELLIGIWLPLGSTGVRKFFLRARGIDVE